MELDKISPAPNFSAFGFKLKFYETEIPQEKQEEINDLMKISDEIYHLPNIVIKTEEKVEPRYEAKEGKIFIPLEYVENNNDIFTTLKQSFGDKFEEIVILHEMGHAVEVDRKTNLHQIDIKNHSDLNYILNGSSVPNNINYFLIENFKEGFADCYSAFCYYKKNGDISVFDKISEARELSYKQMKLNNGEHYIHPNFNTQAPTLFKKIIEELNDKGVDIRSLPFTASNGNNIEKFIEQATIQGCKKALVRELETNDAFLNHFRKVGKEFIEENNGRFKINEYAKSIREYITQKNLDIKSVIEQLNKEAILPYFIEFQKRSDEHTISNDFIKDLINNQKLKRQVNSNLEIADIRVFNESNMERSQFILPTTQIESNIQAIRNQALNNNKTIGLKNN